MSALYDTIGLNYAALRQPDPRIAEQIHSALGDAKTVLNVGAGTGGYEPINCKLTALEPSAEMIKQRKPSEATLVQGIAENLPFDDDSFDASMAVLTIHHWTDQHKGIQELRRVTKGKIVLLTVDPTFDAFWLNDYFPALRGLDEATMPKLEKFQDWFETVDIHPVPVPHDCVDGFLASYWRRPAAYLDPRVRAATSPFHLIGDLTDGLAALTADIDSCAWAQRYANLLQLNELDCGYRLIVAD